MLCGQKSGEKVPVASRYVFVGQKRRKSGQKWPFWPIFGHFRQKPAKVPTRELPKSTLQGSYSGAQSDRLSPNYRLKL